MQNLMQNIFDGYVLCYRKFAWHTTSSYSDMTQVELAHFASLGESLGYQSRREMNWDYPRDLCWVNPENPDQAFMYMERENQDGRCNHTIDKMLNKDNSKNIPLLIAVFGWLTESSFEKSLSRLENSLGENQCALLFAWVGKSQDAKSFIVKAATFNGGVIKTREAVPSLDKGEFWQLNYEKGSKWVKKEN